MMTAIKEIGQMIIEKENKNNLDVMIEDPNIKGTYNKVLCITLEKMYTKYTYNGIAIEDYDKSKVPRYLYRGGAKNAENYSLTAILTEKIDGTIDRKILGWFNSISSIKGELPKDEIDFLSNIEKELKDHSDDIKAAVKAFRDEYPKKEKFILTVVIKENSAVRYPGDIDLFVRLFMNKINIADAKGVINDKVCSICGIKRGTILNKINVYTFYTLDKPGYITGGFDKELAWRNFPVCPECKLALEEGRKHIETNLAFRFCGIPYYLIPKFIMGKGTVAEDVLDIFSSSDKVIALKQQNAIRLTADEEDILYYLKDAKDTITLNFLFLQTMNSAERILLFMEDIFPSRLKRIFNAKAYIDKIFNKNFTFNVIRSFFYKSEPNKRSSDLDNYFFDITDRVFKGRPIDYKFMVEFIMKKVRNEFINDQYFYSSINDGLMSLMFLMTLDIIKMEVHNMEPRLFDELFTKYNQAFQMPLKRGLFLLGALTELLLRKQYADRETKPFLKELKSLKMNEKDIKGLLPKVQNKLIEYDAFDKGKRILAAEASHYLMEAGDGWKLNTDELNFYFSCGMNLADEVASIIYPEKENTNQVE